MRPRSKLRWISALQIVTGILYIASSMFTITTAFSVSREEAMLRLQRDIPPDMPRVFINHGVAYGWPFGRAWSVVGGVLALVSITLLIASLRMVRRVRDEVAAFPKA